MLRFEASVELIRLAPFDAPTGRVITASATRVAPNAGIVEFGPDRLMPLLIVSNSAYVPAPTCTVSPFVEMSIARWIEPELDVTYSSFALTRTRPKADVSSLCVSLSSTARPSAALSTTPPAPTLAPVASRLFEAVTSVT